MFIAVALILVVVYLQVKAYRSPRQLRDMAEAIAGGGVLVDVRTPEEFRGGHHRRAMNIPMSELHGAMDRFESREQAIVLYCRSGSRSGRARRILLTAGFSRVMDLGRYRNMEKLPEIRFAQDPDRPPAPVTRNQRKRQRRRRG